MEMPKGPQPGKFIREAAAAMTDREKRHSTGIWPARQKPGWGEGGAFITAMSNSNIWRMRWFDEELERPH